MTLKLKLNPEIAWDVLEMLYYTENYTNFTKKGCYCSAILTLGWTIQYDGPNTQIQSDLDSTRGSGVPDFKKFSAYNRGPRSKEVYQILASFTAKVTMTYSLESKRFIKVLCRFS
jgi:hypothetical protein